VRFAAFAIVALLASTTAVADDKPVAKKKTTLFGPFDAGDARPVSRQGTKGKARKAFPAVGDSAKVPGEGPPPPSLRLDPDIPEGALDKTNAGGPNAIPGSGLSSSPLYLASLTYANLITKIDGPRCQHLPTCSRFGSQAVAKDGVLGILMTLDRVIQPTESSPLRRLPEVDGFGGVRGYDPIENYEFWHTERFTGLPPKTPEEPLALPSLPMAAVSPETPAP
jgi:hypothetical protein